MHGLIIQPAYDYMQSLENHVRVWLNDKVMLLELTGKVVLTPKYELYYPFVQGLAIVTYNKKYGVIDERGNDVIPLKYDHVSQFINGLTIIKLGNKQGVYDSNGREVIPVIYDEIQISAILKDLIIVKLDNKWGSIGRDGLSVEKTQFDEIPSIFYGIAEVRIGTKWGFLDQKGRLTFHLNMMKYHLI